MKAKELADELLKHPDFDGMTEREEQKVIVLNTLYNNPLLSDIGGKNVRKH